MNLFYVEKTNRAFWVAGYLDNDLNAIWQARMLEEKASQFEEMTGVNKEYVYSFQILNSRRYAGMRVFYGDCPGEAPPKAALFCLKDGQ